jgi:hypothetical protein
MNRIANGHTISGSGNACSRSTLVIGCAARPPLFGVQFVVGLTVPREIWSRFRGRSWPIQRISVDKRS